MISSFALASGGVKGGDPLALQFKATAFVAARTLQSFNRPPFSSVNMSLLLNKISTAQILVTDKGLPVEKNGFIQKSAVGNIPLQNLIIINRPRYEKIQNTAIEQALALHEFLSLMGDESTANYPISGAYLIAKLNPSTGSQEIQLAAQSIVAKAPCQEPAQDSSALFKMIADQGTSAKAVATFLLDHAIAWDAVNNQCETMFMSTLSKNRIDIFQTVMNQYKPNVLTPQPHSTDSIYSYALKFGNFDLIHYIQTKFIAFDETAPLASVTDHLYVDGNCGDSQFYLPVQGLKYYPLKMTELMLAASYNSLDVVQRLVNQASNPSFYVNMPDENGLNSLMYAMWNPLSDSIVPALIQDGAQINSRDSNGDTPLMYAAVSDKVSGGVIRTLVKSGASVNTKDTEWQTAYIYATANNALPEVIQALIQAGAETNAVGSCAPAKRLTGNL